MKKRLLKKLILLTTACVLVVGMVACKDKNELKFEPAGRPVYRPEMVEGSEVQKAPKDYTLSVNGNFSSIKGIKDYVAGYALPEGFGGSFDSGVKVTANSDGASFYYTNIINLYELEDELIEFEVLRNTQDGTRNYSNVSSVEVSLVDVYDVKNSVSVVWKENAAWPTSSYMLVSCNGAEFGRKNDTLVDSYEENGSRPKTGTVNHTNGFSETLYTPYGVKMTHIPFSFRYDAQENQVFGNPSKLSSEYMILDVDDSEYMKNYPLFQGFTTGEVYVKVTFKDITEQGELVITQIGGRDLSASELETVKNDDLIGLEMDYDYYHNALPNGVVGINYPIPVPNEYDEIMGKYEVDTTLSFDGQDCSSLITDAGFIPNNEGTYLLTYTALDANGLSVTRTFDIIINALSEEILITFSEDPMEEYKLFSWISIPRVSMDGGNGKLKEKTVEYRFNGEQIAPNESGKFYASALGDLEIFVSVTDELGQKKQATFSKSVQGVTDLRLQGYIPYGLETGVDFVIPDFSAVDYTTGETRQMTKSVFVNGVQKSVGDIVRMDGYNELCVEFFGDKGEPCEIVKSYLIKAIDGAKAGDMTGVFVKENGTLSQEQYLSYTFNSMENGIKFPYAISAYFFNVRLSALTETMNFDYIDVNMEDSISGQCVTVRFLLENGTTYLVVNGKDGETLKYQQPVKMEKGEYLSFYYDNTERTLLNSNNAKIASVDYDNDGEMFLGFESTAIKLSIQTGKTNGETPSGSIYLHAIGNQSFATTTYEYGDVVVPELAFDKSLPTRTRVGYNTQFILPNAYAWDVLQYQSSIVLKIISPNGQTVYEGDGTSCTFRLTELGSYHIVYELKDSWDNGRKYDYYVEAVDNTAPLITINGEYQSEYRVGDTIKAFSVTVEDDYSSSSAIKVRVYVVDTEFLSTEITGGEYLFTKQGYYKVIYYATDENGNATVEIREIFAW